jgi:hypothetical protein
MKLSLYSKKKENISKLNIDTKISNCGDLYLTVIKSIIQNTALTCQVLDYNKLNPSHWTGILYLSNKLFIKKG